MPFSSRSSIGFAWRNCAIRHGPDSGKGHLAYALGIFDNVFAIFKSFGPAKKWALRRGSRLMRPTSPGLGILMKVILAQPRGFCAGVVRAIEIVERASRAIWRADLCAP